MRLSLLRLSWRTAWGRGDETWSTKGSHSTTLGAWRWGLVKGSLFQVKGDNEGRGHEVSTRACTTNMEKTRVSRIEDRCRRHGRRPQAGPLAASWSSLPESTRRHLSRLTCPESLLVSVVVMVWIRNGVFCRCTHGGKWAQRSKSQNTRPGRYAAPLRFAATGSTFICLHLFL
jgi:hypothetical protein